MDQLPLDYDSVGEALVRAGAGADAAEAHGTMCGLLCTTGTAAARKWALTLIADDATPEGAAASSLLLGLLEETVQGLNDPELDFELLLPEPEAPMSERAAALGDWCQGFLLGLNLGGVKDFARLPADAAEVAQDLAEIAQAGSCEFGENSEEDESAFIELQEYVRMSILLVYEELQPAKAEPRQPKH